MNQSKTIRFSTTFFLMITTMILLFAFGAKDVKAVEYIEKSENHNSIAELKNTNCKFCPGKVSYHSTVIIPVENHDTHHIRHKVECDRCHKVYYTKYVLEEKHFFQAYNTKYEFLNGSKHNVRTYLKCSCGITKTNIVSESHNSAFICRKCKYPEKTDFIATSGMTYYFSNSPWIKITPNKAGYIDIDTEPDMSYGIYDSSKKKLKTYGEPIVLDQKTYYIKLKKDGNKSFKYSFHVATTKNSTLKKATLSKKKKTYSSIFLPSKKKQYRYYKIVLKKKQPITFICDTNSRKKDTFYLIDKKKKNVSIHQVKGSNYYTTYTAQKKGTYYLQVRSLPWSSTNVKNSTGTYVKFYLK